MASKFRDLFRPKATQESASSRTAELLQRAQSLLQQGELENAVQLYGAVIALEPDHAEAHYKRANALNRLGQWPAALTGYDRAIAIHPGYANAFCNRGTVLERLGRWDEALQSYHQTLALNPADFLAYYNRGSVLKELKRLGEARASYEQAIELRPDYAEAHINLGHVLQQLRRHEAAVESYDRAIDLKPVRVEALLGRGISLFNLRRMHEALASYQQAIALQGDYVAAYINRGNVLQELRCHEEAVASYDKAIELEPVHAEAFRGRGLSLDLLKRFEAAIASYDRALALNADEKYLIGMRRFAKMEICDWSDLEPDLERLAAGVRTQRAVATPLVIMALFDSAPLQHLAAQVWVREECSPDDTLGAIPARERADKIKVGYFSADFRDHPVSRLTAELFETHDRSKFEITAFAFGPEASDAMRARLERGFDRFVDVGHQSDIQVASLARELAIDIAVDLGGFTVYSRTKILALRAAPIQLSYIGYLGTMGAPYIDYLVADATIIANGEERDYAEKIIYLPSYQVNDSQRTIAERSFTRAELGLPPQGFVFACFNSNYKIMPATFEAWVRILRRVPDSALFLYAENQSMEANVRQAAQRCGVEAHRIVFGERLAPADYLARFRAMDLFLDTWPYNAGTTASDALWAGLPVLTCTGHAFAGRVAASLLTAIDLPELITSTPAQYEDLAVELATTPARLAQLRQRLARNRRVAPLFDTPLFTRNLEAAYTQIYERYHAGLAPDHIRPGTGSAGGSILES